MCVTDDGSICGRCLVSIGLHVQISKAPLNQSELYECLLHSEVFRNMFYTCLEQRGTNATTCAGAATECFDGSDPYACDACYTAVVAADYDEYQGMECCDVDARWYCRRCRVINHV